MHPKLVRYLVRFGLAWTVLAAASRADPPSFETAAIFPMNSKHNHASCVVQTKEGNLLAAWYAGSGERKSDDVVIEGAWLDPRGTHWGQKFLMADTPGYPDCNPSIFAPPDGSLWLFWPTILDHRWEGALLKFARCEHLRAGAVPIPWSSAGVLHVTPVDFAAEMQKAIARLSVEEKAKSPTYLDQLERRSRDELYQRLGWMPRVHPVVLPSGRWVFPLYSDTFDASIVAISDDRGVTWTTSRPLIGFGNIQPSLVRKSDGALVAFMRDNGSHHRIRLSTSGDEGVSWSPVTDSSFPNPGAGIEAIRLANGHWALIYNDLPRGRHSLAITVSGDEGASWKWTRHLERDAPGQGQFHYPSMIQASDGSIHVTYTYSRPQKGSTIQHARFNESWIQAGDKD
jgi:predicted neuraminidase